MTDQLPQKSLTTPIPTNETERLAALHRYKILDTAPEAAFDRITTLAARLFQMPTALISLVDESRAWFKSRYGFDWQEMPRDVTFCSFALLDDDVLMVPDAQQDDRFACNGFVLGEPGVRFYAGAPLLSHDGFNLGTLCLLDSQPHDPLTVEQQATLVDLAAIVVDELELRLVAHEVAQSETKYRTLFESIDEGFCICELLFDENGEPHDYRFLEINPIFEAVTGLAQATGKTVREFVPALETSWFEIYGKVVRTREPVRFENQALSLNRWFNVNAFCIGEPSSNQFALLFTDITEAKRDEAVRKQAEAALQESEAQSQNILESITDGFFALDLDWQFTYVNPQAERILNRTPGDLLGKVIWEEYPGTVGMEFERAYRRTASERVASSFISFYPDHNSWYEVYAYPAADGITVYFRNVTERKLAEAALQQTSAELERQLQRFDVIASAVPDFIYTFDQSGRFTYSNQQLLNLLQKTSAEVIS
jgi:PAS domain S-box-containing protein